MSGLTPTSRASFEIVDGMPPSVDLGPWSNVKQLLFVTMRVPFFSGTPEPVETIALVSKAAEAAGVIFALPLVTSRMLRPALASWGAMSQSRRPGQRVEAGKTGALDVNPDCHGRPLIVLLVLLVLLVALPLGIGMAMGMCPTSHSSVCPSAAGACAAIVGLMMLVLFGILGNLREWAPLAPVLLLARQFERPPRSFSH